MTQSMAVLGYCSMLKTFVVCTFHQRNMQLGHKARPRLVSDISVI